MRDALEARSAAGELVLLLNTADDPVVERILTPRIALTVAEHLAFELGRHVLVVMADMTSYAEALREVSAARGEIPGRRAYPGYLYSDLASLYERCGRIRGRARVGHRSSLSSPCPPATSPTRCRTSPATSPRVRSCSRPTCRRAGIYPPVEPLSSLSRLMRKGAGPGRTRDDHLDVAAQTLASLARARRARELAELVGEDALSATDRLYLAFEQAVSQRLLDQRRDESHGRSTRPWTGPGRRCAMLPRRELTMLPTALLDARYAEPAAEG